MNRKVLILGGYGNFGKRIAQGLIRHNVPVIIAGRNEKKAETFAHTLPSSLASIAVIDVNQDLAKQLKILKPTVVINTCGPFQTSNYNIACTCINHNVHYIDLADARDFVTGIYALDVAAKNNQVTVISGASTVPGLSSAVIENFKEEFLVIESVIYGISPGQKIERGFATTKAILSYVGKRLKPFIGNKKSVYGWQDIYRQKYPILGKCWMANCDIPDLDLLPQHYRISFIRFSAGLELSFMHLGLWLLSWVVRFGFPIDLTRYTSLLLKVSNWFNKFGTTNSGMHILIRGKDKAGNPHKRDWFVIAKNGDGPNIPCVPAILLAKKLIFDEQLKTGAYPCVGLISLNEYMNELQQFDIQQIVCTD